MNTNSNRERKNLSEVIDTSIDPIEEKASRINSLLTCLSAININEMNDVSDIPWALNSVKDMAEQLHCDIANLKNKILSNI